MGCGVVIRRKSQGSAESFIPEQLTLPGLQKAAADCKACDLWENATQTVFGEGNRSAKILFIGEQPGNDEDLKSHFNHTPCLSEASYDMPFWPLVMYHNCFLDLERSSQGLKTFPGVPEDG